MKKLKFAKMIAKFGVDFQYQNLTTTKNKMRETVKGFSDPISVHEPLLPYNQGDMPASSAQTTRMVITDSGTIETADMVWYSLKDVSIGARVLHHSKQYTVIAIEDYSDYSDVKVYYLKGQTNL